MNAGTPFPHDASVMYWGSAGFKEKKEALPKGTFLEAADRCTRPGGGRYCTQMTAHVYMATGLMAKEGRPGQSWGEENYVAHTWDDACSYRSADAALEAKGVGWLHKLKDVYSDL